MSDPIEPTRCPFCGGTDLDVDNMMGRAYVVCGGCRAMGPEAQHNPADDDNLEAWVDNRREVAVAAWNRRGKPEDPAKPWLILAPSPGGDGECIWWREGGSGYTMDLNIAGRFSEEEVRARVSLHEGLHRPVLASVAVAESYRLDCVPRDQYTLERLLAETLAPR